nr:MAG TPA: hypothetical protein [Caudoviricetes sp.]
MPLTKVTIFFFLSVFILRSKIVKDDSYSIS